jgi:DNA-binding NtrC family response regulator
MTRSTNTRPTCEDTITERHKLGASRPGVVLVWTGHEPGHAVYVAFEVPPGGLTVGRGADADLALADDRASRVHARITFESSSARIEDLGSKNGTFADGELVRPGASMPSRRARVLRVGRSLLLPVADIAPHLGGQVASRDGVIAGPALSAAWSAIARAAKLGDTLHVSGESGTGKELAARHFHASGPHRDGPFVPVNCAAIPAGLAERLLFGAKRGAFSGADSDVDGYVQAADGGTLFLDELAELDPLVQAKLLRVLEAREVLPLGATRARPVRVRICSATHADLAEAVAAKRFRADLFYRLGRPEVALPPLRERPAEIAWIVEHEAKRAGVQAQTSLVEACLLRDWPGNVRELQGEIRRAAREAADRGATTIDAALLSPRAGLALPVVDLTSEAPRVAERTLADREADAIEEALQAEGGNVTAAARRLGVHRNQLRRFLERSRCAVDP